MEVEFTNDAEGVEISIILIAKRVGLLQECSLVEINAFKKEKTDFLTTNPILSLSSPGTLSNDFQWEVDSFFSSILVQVCRPHKP